MKTGILIGTNLWYAEQVRLAKRLNLGDIVLTYWPHTKKDAVAAAKFCRDNQLYLAFRELMHRGTFEFKGSKEDLNEVIDILGQYYFGRMVLGEIGGVVYWPKAYTVNRRMGRWENLPAVRTMQEAKDAYIAYIRRFLDYERKQIAKGTLFVVDSSLLAKYHAMAGVDALILEVMPGDPHLMQAAFRGSARVFGKRWGAHIAMQCYGGCRLDELWQRRYKTVLYFSYISGAQSIWSERSQFNYNQNNRQKFAFGDPGLARNRRLLREAYQFNRIHTRPPDGPKVRLAIAHGNLDGAPGLWNRCVWGQYKGTKWLEGPAERGWRFVDKLNRKQDWPKETVHGDSDLSGSPPYGQYDVVPIEAPLDALRKYSCLLFLAWNTMTHGIYDKLKAYVSAGGRLVMYLSHLSVETDRARPIKLYRDGNFADLFGARVLGRAKKKIQGVNCLADSSIKSYRFPRWRVSTDPRFMGRFTPATMALTTAKVISGYCDYYRTTAEYLNSHPFLIENKVGRGRAFLVAAWEWPADEGLYRFTEDLLRVLVQGEQGDISLLSTDRIRWSVFQGTLPRSRRKYQVVYLLNVDPYCDAVARLLVKGNTTQPFMLSANELRLAYLCGDLLLVPEDKLVDIDTWETGKHKQNVTLFSAASQKVEVHNTGKRPLAVSLNGAATSVEPGDRKRMRIKRRVDPGRKEFFANGFLREPEIECPPLA